ncbi:helix-turn-helix transcriptional regulator [Companilactobacillus mishanensis]|uniref:Helix-turn-helix transcriptional regulator n=1 Tax=Companilactobacillus mishanensis TaxID=2486008 RepID=A0ABW9P970_9LACO|nr:helix-turn-helix transcriptional regulator [Companilactobacillus mishanensis]MQS45785.1 helix-turn-helix transcriptional regulator [Companilactobacillus mishanensis]
MKNSLGTTIRNVRVNKKMSQKNLADGICAQSMLSAIENDKYTPNAKLLIELCNRLSLSLTEISLSQNFDISSIDKFNDTVEKLCNAHEYKQLHEFLLQDSVIDNLKSDTQLQAYYYYLSISQLQTGDFAEAEKSLKLSLADINRQSLSTLSRLGYMSLSLLNAIKLQNKSAIANLNAAFESLSNQPYEENQNILFYLASLIYFKIHDLAKSTDYLNQGIKFIAKNNSHYMLANCYFLSAELADTYNQPDKAAEARKREKIFSELYGEKVFKDI